MLNSLIVVPRGIRWDWERAKLTQIPSALPHDLGRARSWPRRRHAQRDPPPRRRRSKLAGATLAEGPPKLALRLTIRVSRIAYYRVYQATRCCDRPQAQLERRSSQLCRTRAASGHERVGGARGSPTLDRGATSRPPHQARARRGTLQISRARRPLCLSRQSKGGHAGDANCLGGTCHGREIRSFRTNAPRLARTERHGAGCLRAAALSKRPRRRGTRS